VTERHTRKGTERQKVTERQNDTERDRKRRRDRKRINSTFDARVTFITIFSNRNTRRPEAIAVLRHAHTRISQLLKPQYLILSRLSVMPLVTFQVLTAVVLWDATHGCQLRHNISRVSFRCASLMSSTVCLLQHNSVILRWNTVSL